ncbi:MAG: hypothetical protein H6601_12420 [Flavobacteriales bacterium]|nr:hypothetical protein [Flavobacteriales bacterium]
MKRTITLIYSVLMLTATQLSAQNSDYWTIDATVEEVVEFLNSSDVRLFYYPIREEYDRMNGLDDSSCCLGFPESKVTFSTNCSLEIIYSAQWKPSVLDNECTEIKGRINVPIQKLTHSNVIMKSVTGSGRYSEDSYTLIIIPATEPIESVRQKIKSKGCIWNNRVKILSNTSEFDPTLKDGIQLYISTYNCATCADPDRILRAIQFLIFKCGGAEGAASKF